MTKPLKINWEYCECGCKSCCVTILGMHFSYYDTLNSKVPYYYAETHNARSNGRPMPSYEAINSEVRKRVEQRKKELKQEIAELEA